MTKSPISSDNPPVNLRTLAQLIPRPNTRSILVGKTGEGKTTLAYTLLSGLRRENCVVIIDPKGRFRYDAPEIDSADGLADMETGAVIYRPGLRSDVVGDVDRIAEAIYGAAKTQGGRIVLYIDELYGCQEGGKWPAALQALYTRGRELGITVIAAVQRPAWVPLYTISETENQYLFRTTMEEDRKRMASIMGPAALTLPPKHAFYYQSLDRDIAPTYPIRLNIGG